MDLSLQIACTSFISLVAILMAYCVIDGESVSETEAAAIGFALIVSFSFTIISLLFLIWS